ncbi:hypothetical protein HRU45_02915 [Candidatus Dependentiae bacterium]|nr:hypothetical protein [Candidatus Dependentiae bacterium]
MKKKVQKIILACLLTGLCTTHQTNARALERCITLIAGTLLSPLFEKTIFAKDPETDLVKVVQYAWPKMKENSSNFHGHCVRITLAIKAKLDELEESEKKKQLNDNDENHPSDGANQGSF